MSSTHGNNVCRTCLSTEGELISLFSETCHASRITKKIMSISNAPIDKEDGLPDKICRKCIYLLESFYCFKNQLISADKRLRNVWAEEEEKNGKGVSRNKLIPSHNEVIHDELDYDIEWISDEERIKVEKAFRRKWAREDKKKLQETRTMKSAETQVSLLRKDLWNKTIKSEKPAAITKDVMVKIKKPKDVIKNNIVKCEEPKDVIEDDVHKTGEPRDIKDNIVKSEELKDIKPNIPEFEDIEGTALKSEEPAVSMEDEPIDGQNHDYVAKQELLQNEELSDTLRSDKSDDARCANEAKEKEVIVISDSSDEVDSSELPRAVVAPVSMNPLEATGNGAYTISIVSSMYPNSRQIIRIPRVPPRVKNIAGFEKKKESPCREAANAEKTSATSSPRRFFQCTRCNVNLFTVAAVLLHHNQVHTPNKASLCCRMCDKTFPAKSNLFEHFNQHIESHLFRCSFCPNEFVMKKNLVEHMKIHKKRAGLAENKSANKRVRVNSGSSMEVSHEARQRANKKHGSPIAPKDSEDSDKENIDIADLRMPSVENLTENPVKEAEKEDNVFTANPAGPVMQSAFEHRTEQEEECTGNENQMVIDSEASAVENLDTFVVDQ